MNENEIKTNDKAKYTHLYIYTYIYDGRLNQSLMLNGDYLRFFMLMR